MGWPYNTGIQKVTADEVKKSDLTGSVYHHSLPFFERGATHRQELVSRYAWMDWQVQELFLRVLRGHPQRIRRVLEFGSMRE